MKSKIGVIHASFLSLVIVSLTIAISLGGFAYYHQNISNTMEVLTEKKSTLVAHIENVSNENEQLQSSVEEKNKELESVKKDITELETSIDSLESELAKLQKQKDALTNE